MSSLPTPSTQPADSLRSLRDTNPEAYAALLDASPAALLWDLTDGAYDPFPRHVRELSRRLAMTAAGTSARLLIEEPPRHGKSELVSHGLPVWFLNRWPHKRVILATHTGELSEYFGRKSRNTIATNEDSLRVQLDPDSSAAGRWDTTEGGGFLAVGVGAAVVGRGAHLIIVDDPIKGSEAAYSKTQRDAVWRWWQDDLLPRREPGAVMIVMHQRWHKEDLAGRLLDRERARWERLRLPAIAEDDDPLGRAPGEPLWPERWPLEALRDIEAGMSPHAWSAEYQQDPRAFEEGALVGREYLTVVTTRPVSPYVTVRFWDCAATKQAGCYTVGVRAHRDVHGVIWFDDVVRGQWDAGDVEHVILSTARLDGEGVAVRWEEEPGSAGKAVTAARRRMLIGYDANGIPATGAKWIRAQPFASWARAGHVRVVAGPWVEPWLSELSSATPDMKGVVDQVDATGGAFNWLATRPVYADPGSSVPVTPSKRDPYDDDDDDDRGDPLSRASLRGGFLRM